MKRLSTLVSDSEDRILRILLGYALEHGYVKYSSTLEEAWRMSVRVLSSNLIQACNDHDGPPELGPDQNYVNDPIAQFGILEARRHRERGISIDMFLGLMKYYRQSYLDLVMGTGFDGEYEEKCRRFIDRSFDRIEIGLCKEWMSTDQSLLVAELQASNRYMTNEKNKYLTVFESSSHPALLLNSDLNVENLNHAAVEMLQGSSIPGSSYYGSQFDEMPESTGGKRSGAFPRSQPVGKIFPEAAEDFEAFAMGAKTIHTMEKQLNLRGTHRCFEVVMSKMLDISEKFSGMLVTLTDITTRKKAEDNLRNSEAQFRFLTEKMKDVVWVLDVNTMHLRYVSPSVERLRGYTPEEVMSFPIQQVFSPEDPEKKLGLLQCRLEDFNAGKLPPDDFYTFEMRQRCKDGSTIWVEAIAKFQVNWNNGHVEVHGVSRDISERKRQEAAKALLEAEIRHLQKAESLGRMAGAIAHLFNNQLSVVMGNLELALLDLPEQTPIRDSLIQALGATRRSSEISSLMLTYLGQNAGKPELLDLSELCRRNLPKFQQGMPEGIALKANLLSSGPLICAHANQVQQILTNLITNGRESIGDRTGTITLGTRIIPSSEIPKSDLVPVGWKPAGDLFACLEVADTGCGIGGEDLDKIFDPFFTTKFTGRGLGLCVILGIVKLWGGAIGVQTRKNQGSIFSIFFPLAAGELPRSAEKASETHLGKPGGTVLLVDDQDLVRNMAASMLGRLGFGVLAASDGAEAVRLLEENPDQIRCVMTDLNMPGMDGWKTLAALRKIQPHMPAIVVSGYDEEHAMTGDCSEQPRVFLQKPYSKNDLLGAIEAALETPVSTR